MATFNRDISNSELLHMRDQGMTNQDIANALGVTCQTVRNRIGKQPQGMRGGRVARNIKTLVKPTAPVEEPASAAFLVVEDRTISLAGTFGSYVVYPQSQRVEFSVADNVVKFDQLDDFINELKAISRKIPMLQRKNEVW